MDKNVTNIAAAIVNDRRYPDLKTSVYEELVAKDHATVVALFKLLQEWATEAEDNQFIKTDMPTKSVQKVISHDLEIDPDLDDSLTDEELVSRR